MTDERWECWAEHREDLTDRVTAARSVKRPWAFRSVAGIFGRTPAPQMILITCSEGHENVIEFGSTP